MSAAVAVRSGSRFFRPQRVGLLGAGLALCVAVGAFMWWSSTRPGAGPVEFRMPDPEDIPATLALAPDGAVWFTLESSDALGVLRDGQLRRVPRGGGETLEALGLGVDANGGVWFTDISGQSIRHVAADGTKEAFRVPGPLAQFGRLALGSDGTVWFADSWGNSITHIQNGQLVPHSVREANAAPFGVAVDNRGTVWATLQIANKIVRIDLDGALTELDVPTRNATPADVAVDGVGTVWFTELRANKIGRYSDERFEEFAVPSEAAGLTSLAVAPDGSVWFTELRQQKLARLRNGSITEFPLARQNARPFSVVVDAGGNVWYTDLSGWVGKLPAEQARADHLDLGKVFAWLVD